MIGSVTIGSIASQANSGSSGGAPSAFSMTNNHFYQPSRDSWIYLPSGYNLGSNYPVVIFLLGDGARSNWASATTAAEGLLYYLANGVWDGLMDCIVMGLQLTVADGDYNEADFDSALSYLSTNSYKIDTNRVYVTGLSRGAMGTNFMLQNRYTQIAAVLPISGPVFDTGWASYNNIGFWQHHGTADSTFGRTIGSTLYRSNGASGAWIDLTPAPRTTYYYGKGHSQTVWSNEVYNPGSAKFNFFYFLSKFNKDAVLQATQFTEYAESTNNIVDYREAKMLTDALSSSAEKTALLARLSALLVVINKGGTRYYVSLQGPFIGSLNPGYNIMTAFATGNGITNIVDVDNNPSTIDVTITQEFASSSRDSNASNNNAGRMKAKGFDDYRINLSGMVINAAITNGVVTIGGIPSGKLLDIAIHNHHVAADDDTSAITAESRIMTSVNGTYPSSTSNYSAYNNAYYVLIEGTPETSGNVALEMHTYSTRNVIVQALELLVY